MNQWVVPVPHRTHRLTESGCMTETGRTSVRPYVTVGYYRIVGATHASPWFNTAPT
ncbi:MAG: hypothetical protein AB7F20_13245 [Geoalkalibacter sp.]|uniref:hypothetical protein n=1 Tax=Geoalkalibacter sp. TaxID=3041440 RepID=UPI003D0C3E46